MACPCCAEDLAVTVGGNAAAEVHSAQITLSANTEDSAVFGDGPYGSISACKRSGTIVLNSWCPIGSLDIGDSGVTTAVIFTVCDSTITAATTTISDINISLDANGANPVDWSYTFRVEDTVTIV